MNVCATENNATQKTVTLSFTATYPGNRTVTGTKQITIGVITDAVTDEFVDLGLRSGTLWRRSNIGATNPEDAGLYFAWGETTGYASATARGTNGFDSATYNAGSAASISADLTDEQDAAKQILGVDYSMPTWDQIYELMDGTNTDQEWVVRNGVRGVKFMNPLNHRKYIFLPAVGYYDGTNMISEGPQTSRKGLFLSREISLTSGESMCAQLLDANNQTKAELGSHARYLGGSIRPVKAVVEWVDLGLPSGNLWRSSNLGTTTPSAFGNYYAWGEMSGYADANARNASLSRTDGFSTEAYSAVGAYNIETDLDLSHDAANRALGGSETEGYCVIPSTADFQELIDNTDYTWGQLDGVSGGYFANKSDSRVKIFIPVAGYYSNNDLNGLTGTGNYWTSSISNQ